MFMATQTGVQMFVATQTGVQMFMATQTEEAGFDSDTWAPKI